MELQERRKALVGPTARLVEFLRDLVRAGNAPIRNIAQYETFRWLEHLPPEAMGTIDIEAGPGDHLFGLDYLPAEPPPPVPDALKEWLSAAEVDDSAHPGPVLAHPDPSSELLAEHDRWLDVWRVWAEDDLRDRPRREWYDFLAATARQLDQHDDEVELVLGCGVVSWASPTGQIQHPLLTVRLGVTTSTETGRVDVFIAEDATTRVNDRQLLDGVESFQAVRVQHLREEWRSGPVVPLSDEHKDRFLHWSEHALDRCRAYRHVWEPNATITTTPEIRFSPVLIFRKRDRTNLVDYYDRILEALSGPDALAPLGLAQLLGAIEAEDRMAWLDAEGAVSGEVLGSEPLMPLPANPEQREIVTRLKHENGVVVQGPPGTGKTHTIANLLAALLARGQRVLVTSQKAQALRVLKDQLPEPIQELCVSMTDVGRGGSRELDRGVTALSDNYAHFEEAAHAERTRRLEADLRAAQQRVAEVKESLRRLRESETVVHPLIAPGYEGKIGRIAEALTANQVRHGWIPVPYPEGSSVEPPMGRDELLELRELLIEASPAREARRDQRLVPMATLPAPQRIREMVGEERAANEVADSVASEASSLLGARSRADLAMLQAAIQELNDSLSRLRLGPVPADWSNNEWFVQALRDAFSNREFAVWEQFAVRADEAGRVQSSLSSIGLQEVVLPQFEPSGPNSLAAQLVAGRTLQEHLAAGNKIKKVFASQAQRDAGRLMEGASVDGRSITHDPGVLDTILTVMDAERVDAALSGQWRERGIDLDGSLPLERRIARLVDLASQLDAVLEAKHVRDRVESTLLSWGIRLPLGTPEEWFRCAEFVAAADLAHRAREATAILSTAIDQLEHLARDSGAPPELFGLARAIAARDADQYTSILDQYSRAEGEQQRQNRCDALFATLRTAHPSLAAALAAEPDDDAWVSRFAAFDEAWAWGLAWSYVERLRSPGLDMRLAEQLTAATDQVGNLTAELAAVSAWGECLKRMTAHQEQALKSYQEHISNLGKGTGKWAHRFAWAAREAMVEARGAVPAWIMPMQGVIDTIPPDRDAFDVVIVDEASQSGIEALFLLWLAPRVIVVGDERQCAPSTIVRGGHQQIYDRLDDYLDDVPEFLKMAFTPQANLFSLLSTRFSAAIKLREHFRCMPEIIKWSSDMFYRDKPLIPLRQFGGDRLAPLKTVYVPNAVDEGTSSQLRNLAEAEAIAASVESCIADPAYDGLTLGIITLQGNAQARLIESLLVARVPADEYERRKIRVGSAPDFQGDQRNVIFLSMIVADRRSALTSREWQRRFNVAASRAKDQMWLFHSVTVDQLRPADLRRSLLAYMLNPPAALRSGRFDDLRWDSELRPPFDSKFEQRVYIALRDRGYAVVPQFEINHRRIDLLVIGAKGQLAVECDGEFWHTSHEDQINDLDRELELRRAGVQFWRIRDSEFYLDPEAALAPLWEALEARGIRPGDYLASGSGASEAAADWELPDLSEEEGLDGLDGESPDLLDDPGGAPRSRPIRRVPQRRVSQDPQEIAARADQASLPDPPRTEVAPSRPAAASRPSDPLVEARTPPIPDGELFSEIDAGLATAPLTPSGRRAAADLRPGDVVFVPRTGKRLVVERRGDSVFLDFARNPRVKGSRAARKQMVPQDPRMRLGWVQLSGTFEVLHHVPGVARLGDQTALPLESLAHDAPDPVSDQQEHRRKIMTEATAELDSVQRELVLIAERRGGKPLTQHVHEIQRRLRALASMTAELPDRRPYGPLKQHVLLVRGSADLIAASLAQGGDGSKELNHLIGSIQDYGDDT